MIIRDPKVRVMGKGHVAICNRDGEPVIWTKDHATTRDAAKRLRRLVEAIIDEHAAQAFGPTAEGE